MSILRIDAHNVDKDFEEQILSDYGVTIIDMAEAPWTVVFEGPKDKLIEMVNDHWGDDTYSIEALTEMIK